MKDAESWHQTSGITIFHHNVFVNFALGINKVLTYFTAIIQITAEHACLHSYYCIKPHDNSLLTF